MKKRRSSKLLKTHRWMFMQLVLIKPCWDQGIFSIANQDYLSLVGVGNHVYRITEYTYFQGTTATLAQTNDTAKSWENTTCSTDKRKDYLT